MKTIPFIGVVVFLVPLLALAADSYYCPQNSGNIKVGMTMDQVIKACGDPISKKESKDPLTKKVPVLQLIYNNVGADTAFYDTWTIRTGSGGTELQINVIDDIVREVKVDDGDSNAATICEGETIDVGDDVSKVYNACGGPSMVNETFIEVVVETKDKPQIWIYQSSQYTKPVSLTFADGKLQSIR